MSICIVVVEEDDITSAMITGSLIGKEEAGEAFENSSDCLRKSITSPTKAMIFYASSTDIPSSLSGYTVYTEAQAKTLGVSSDWQATEDLD